MYRRRLLSRSNLPFPARLHREACPGRPSQNRDASPSPSRLRFHARHRAGPASICPRSLPMSSVEHPLATQAYRQFIGQPRISRPSICRGGGVPWSPASSSELCRTLKGQRAILAARASFELRNERVGVLGPLAQLQQPLRSRWRQEIGHIKARLCVDAEVQRRRIRHLASSLLLASVFASVTGGRTWARRWAK